MLLKQIRADAPAGTAVLVRGLGDEPWYRTRTSSVPTCVGYGTDLVAVVYRDTTTAMNVHDVYYDNPDVAAATDPGFVVGTPVPAAVPEEPALAALRRELDTANACYEAAARELADLRERVAQGLDAARPVTNKTGAVEETITELVRLVQQARGETGVGAPRAWIAADDGAVASRLRELEEDIQRGLKIAHGVTLETQTVEEACTDLVRLLRKARTERDAALDRVQALSAYVQTAHKATALELLDALTKSIRNCAGEQRGAISEMLLMEHLAAWKRVVEERRWEPLVESKEGCGLSVGAPAPAPFPAAPPLHAIEACRDLQRRIAELGTYALGIMKSSSMGPAVARGFAHVIHHLGRAHEVFDGR